MSTPSATRIGRVRGATQRTAFGVLAASLLSAAAQDHRTTWPAERYQADPVAFARDALGVEPWEKQCEILAALIPPRARVSVSSGHKIGKSELGAMAALWFWGSWPDARVICTAPTATHIDLVLWRAIRRQYQRAGYCIECRAKMKANGGRGEHCAFCSPLGGEIFDLARSGLRAPDFRQIVGFTARDAEAVAGISGPNMLYVIDEASGVGDDTFEAIEGNRAGGVRVLMLGNPTRNTGEFFNSRHEKKKFYTSFQVSSEETPNVVAGREVVPGLATREWVDEKREEWGEDSSIYLVRVKGQDPPEQADSLVSAYDVGAAEKRWHEMEAKGRLHLGCDPAKFGDDESAIAARRGKKILELTTYRKLDEAALAFEIVQVSRRLRAPRERAAAVKVDTNGPIGAELAKELKKYPADVEVFSVNGTVKPTRPREYRLLRDEIAHRFAGWLRFEGAIPEDGKLEGELCATRRYFDKNRLLYVDSNDEIKKRLRRSPDRRNACELAWWEPSGTREGGGEPEPPDLTDVAHAPAIDPYASLDPYAGGIDPYGGIF